VILNFLFELCVSFFEFFKIYLSLFDAAGDRPLDILVTKEVGNIAVELECHTRCTSFAYKLQLLSQDIL